MTNTPFTLVSTIFNEASRLKQTIGDLEAQTLKPSEIIITDAGSNDGSIKILEDWKKESDIKITVLIEKGCNVARGRNLAIEAASTEWIVSTDFGCRFHKEWLDSLLSPLSVPSTYRPNNLTTYRPNNPSIARRSLNTNDPKVIGGSFSVIEKDIQTKAAKANYILSAGYQPVLSEGFIPSSRSIAYKKEVWELVGKYPEWLSLAADDLVFGMKIQSQNIPIRLVDNPYVYWGRHEKRQQYNKEAFRYGLGDGEAKVNYKNFWSNLIETGLRYLLFLSIIIWVGIFIHTQYHVSTITQFFNSSIPQLNDLSTYRPNLLTHYWPMILLSVFSLAGLRSYYGTLKNWLKFKSSKYNLSTLFYALFMLEQQRLNYIKGYIKGYWYSSDKIKQGAKELHGFLGKVK